LRKKQNNDKNKGIKFEDYIILGLLGTGSFGRVFKVKLKDDLSDKVYAMKVINKNLLIRKKQLKYALGENTVLKKCDCPFIVKLYYSFQTLENLYMVEQYCQGGDLQYHLKINLFEEEDAKFYIAEIILAIEYLHNLHTIYRDLKPENILIGEDNHIVLADFGLAKEGITGREVSQSFCGSPAYLPPETVNMKGVGKSGDIYGIGAVLYEMISGTPPFFANEIAVLFNKIRNCQLVLHHYFSEDLKDLLRKLLEKDPDKRLGIFDKNEIKKHRFFKGINWEKLKNKEINPPFNLIKQKIDNDKSLNDNKKNKMKKNIKFTDIDYSEENKYSKRVIKYTFIREEANNE
jgi:serine/threonine protein kinase